MRLFIFEFELEAMDGKIWSSLGGQKALIQSSDPEDADQIFLKQIDGSKYRLADPYYSRWEVEIGKGMTMIT